MYCCDSCSYTSNRKLNLKRHVLIMHDRDLYDNELINKTLEEPPITNTHISTHDQQIHTNIISSDQQIPIENKNQVCEKCQKNFISSWGFKKHQKTCKGVSNILECHHCHKVFSSSSSKSKHIKTCNIKEAKMIAEQCSMITNIINNANNANDINNTQANSNNSNNISRKVYNIKIISFY